MTPTEEQFRASGYTEYAAQFPMEAFAMKLFAAFNGTTVDKLPESFKYHPNQWSQAAWTRVAEAAKNEH